MFKKILSAFLSLTLVFSLAAPAFAAEMPDAVEPTPALNDITLDVSMMSEDEFAIYQDVLNTAIAQYKSVDPNFDEVRFVEEVNQMLYLMEYGAAPYSFIEFSIPNGAVATAVNVVVSLLCGGATTAAISAFISKYGATVATNMLVKEITAKLLALGIRELSGLGTVIRTVVKNILDPGSTVAEWLDSKDPNPGNGYVDVAIG